MGLPLDYSCSNVVCARKQNWLNANSNSMWSRCTIWLICFVATTHWLSKLLWKYQQLFSPPNYFILSWNAQLSISNENQPFQRLWISKENHIGKTGDVKSYLGIKISQLSQWELHIVDPHEKSPLWRGVKKCSPSVLRCKKTFARFGRTDSSTCWGRMLITFTHTKNDSC